MKIKESTRNLSRLLIVALLVVGMLMVFTSSVLALFTNGDFETGTLAGWTLTHYINNGLTGSPPFTEANIVRTAGGTDLTAVLGPAPARSLSDPNAGGDNLTYPYEGQYCARINFESSSAFGHGRNANSLLQQSVTTAADKQGDGKIHVQFAWAGVAENPGHSANQQPYVFVSMKNITKGTLLYEKFYFSDPTNPIWKSASPTSTSILYTDWQIMNQAFTPQELAVGDTVQIECIAAGCSQSGHWGYLYVDGFGSIPPGPCPKPTVISVTPTTSETGDCPMTITIKGREFTDAQSVNLGKGITVKSFTVDSATQITAIICVAPNAVDGYRTVTVATPCGSATKLKAFTVVDPLLNAGPPRGSGSVAAPSWPLPVSMANLQVKSASLSATTVSPNTPVTVTADIANNSTVNGNKMVTVYVNGEIETTQGVTLNSSSASQLTFNVSRSEPGTYKVYVDGAPAGSFTVEAITANDAILIVSVAFLAIAFVCGLIMLRRRQQHG
ncbi:MAG: hypothetical protein NTZ34_05700 [Chloroflexi bacterium]|nr:hypothetical protein [Chloroflexota bacterium]